MAQSQVPVTFGQVFAAGDVPAGQRLSAVIAERARPCPCRWTARPSTHGSLRHAVLSVVRRAGRRRGPDPSAPARRRGGRRAGADRVGGPRHRLRQSRGRVPRRSSLRRLRAGPASGAGSPHVDRGARRDRVARLGAALGRRRPRASAPDGPVPRARPRRLAPPADRRHGRERLDLRALPTELSLRRDRDGERRGSLCPERPVHLHHARWRADVLVGRRTAGARRPRRSLPHRHRRGAELRSALIDNIAPTHLRLYRDFGGTRRRRIPATAASPTTRSGRWGSGLRPRRCRRRRPRRYRSAAALDRGVSAESGRGRADRDPGDG